MASAARASARSVMATNVVARAPVAIVASAAAMVSVLMVRTSSPRCAAQRASAVPLCNRGARSGRVANRNEFARLLALGQGAAQGGRGPPRDDRHFGDAGVRLELESPRAPRARPSEASGEWGPGGLRPPGRGAGAPRWFKPAGPRRPAAGRRAA